MHVFTHSTLPPFGDNSHTAVNSFLSAEERIPTISLCFPKFKYELWWYNSFKAKHKSCNDLVLRSSCRDSQLLKSVPSSFL